MDNFKNKYFTIENTTDAKSIGRDYPQSYWKDDCGLLEHFWSAKETKTLDNNFKLPPLILEAKAKLTDVLSHHSMSYLLVISSKFKLVLVV